jgi:hypothetical protein
MLLSMMAAIIQTRKRKGCEPRERKNYLCGPIDYRERMRSEHLNNKIGKNDVTCVDMEMIRNLLFLKQGLFEMNYT